MTRNAWGALEGTVSASVASIELPVLTDWKYKDSLPEIRYGYNDVSSVSFSFEVDRPPLLSCGV